MENLICGKALRSFFFFGNFFTDMMEKMLTRMPAF